MRRRNHYKSYCCETIDCLSLDNLRNHAVPLVDQVGVPDALVIELWSVYKAGALAQVARRLKRGSSASANYRRLETGER